MSGIQEQQTFVDAQSVKVPIMTDPEKLERRREIARNWARKNRTKMRLYWNEYKEKNHDKLLQKNKKYRAENKDKCSNYLKRRRLETNNKASKDYYEKNKWRYKAYCQAYRAKKRDNGIVEIVIAGDIYKRDLYICQICHRKIDMRLSWPNPFSASIDHIIPISKGGTHENKNVQSAHLKCNMQIKCGGTKQLRLF